MSDSSEGHCISDIMLTSFNTLYFKMDIFGVRVDGNQPTERERKMIIEHFFFFPLVSTWSYLLLALLGSKEVAVNI